jgi:hypothetical protein
MLNFVGLGTSESLVSKEIMMGIMARIIALEEPFSEYKNAFAEQMGFTTSPFVFEII